jgi:choline dehydrogenase
MRDNYDYVIVGAGSCVLANRLSENPCNRVLLVEAGPGDGNPFISMPIGTGRLMRSEAGAKYFSFYQVSPGENRDPNFWLKGRTLGGSSSINGMVYMRGFPSDYDRWEELGATGWGWETMGRCFRVIENHELGPADWRGGDGPLRVSMARLDKLGRATLAASVEAGTEAVEDVNDPVAQAQGGVGAQPCTIWRGRRFSSSRAFLEPVQRRSNLDIATETEVLGITFEGLKATGVRLKNQAGKRSISAREVILSAGGIHSPKLLQLAGIGPAELLKAHGIEVRSDSPEVGRNLQDHRTVKTVHRLKRGGRNRQLLMPGLAWSALKYVFAGRGALSTPIWEVGGLVKTLPGLDEPDCQIGATLFTYDETGICKEPGLELCGYVLRPESRGEVRIASADPAIPPEINANFLSEEYDRVHTASLFRHLRKIAAQPALSSWVGDEVLPGPAAISGEDLAEASFAQGACAMHVSGTCRTGSDEGAVLDPDLRVRGVSGLRVVDTSVMPRLVSGNTNGPAMALAWHAAERILAAE